MSHKPEWLQVQGNPWRSIAQRPIYDNPWIAVTEHDAVAPTGAAALYGLVSFKNFAIAILPLHDDGTITLVGQSRFPLGTFSWEIPEGGGPLADDPLESARRELREETGLEADDWRLLGRMQLSNSVSDEIAFGFLATGLRAGVAAPEPTEQLSVIRVPFREALDAVIAGDIEDVLTVAMVLRGYHMAREGSLPGALAHAMLG
jgi:8-oxo-dGTP pyrophosphatase MutT (NUDIX family)